MSLNGSQNFASTEDTPPSSANAASAPVFDKRAPGIERFADRYMHRDQLMSSAHDRLMSSHHDRLMASGNRTSYMKPPPGITQPPNDGVNPANVSAALADYERKKVMASKGAVVSQGIAPWHGMAYGTMIDLCCVHMYNFSDYNLV